MTEDEDTPFKGMVLGVWLCLPLWALIFWGISKVVS